MATKLYVPEAGAVMVVVAVPPETVAEPTAVPFSVKLTFPVGVLELEARGVMVAVTWKVLPAAGDAVY